MMREYDTMFRNRITGTWVPFPYDTRHEAVNFSLWYAETWHTNGNMLVETNNGTPRTDNHEL